MRETLTALRGAMKAQNIDGYLVPTTDFHGSEYVNKYFKCREWLSGFTGSAGTLLVTAEEAKLWTDGRYFLQAAQQLAGSGIDLMKEGEPGVPTIAEYLEANFPDGGCLGFDGRVVNAQEGEAFAAKYRLRVDLDLAGELWTDRPLLKAAPIYGLPLEVTGETAESKLQRIREAMKAAGADCHLVTRLETIAWMYNLRGDDVKNTPVFFAFAIIEADRDRLYVLDESFAGSQAAASLPETTEILPYFQAYEDVKKLQGGKILLNKNGVGYALTSFLPENMEIIDRRDPAELMKAVKNPVEIACTREAHRKDGAAVVQFIRWLKAELAAGRKVTEIDAGAYVDQRRAEKDGYLEPSFTTIAGYGSNGAIVHYSATEETNKVIKPEGFLLVDSGGQYMDGSTDITRTIAAGPLTDEMKKHYTLVLKGHIALELVKFDGKVSGADLDHMARKPLLEQGLNYNHGTGHGVGHILSIHEGPNTINPRAVNVEILPGMITSDEPGLYLEGAYGIRLENEILCVDAGEGLRGFEPLTWCPWERNAIDKTMLSTEEIEWVDDYHKKVYCQLAPYLDQETCQWLAEMTAPL